MSLTSVFGMGTGGTSQPLTPTKKAKEPSKLNKAKKGEERIKRKGKEGQALDRLVPAG